jgi:hypothetical protein
VIQLNTNPPLRIVWQFAVVWLPVFCAIVAAVAWARTHSLAAAMIALAVGATSLAVGVVRPAWMRPVFVGWTLAAFPIGWLVSHLILAIIFYLVMTPIGLALRLTGHDPLRRRLNRSATSYWIEYNPHSRVERYFRQY